MKRVIVTLLSLMIVSLFLPTAVMAQQQRYIIEDSLGTYRVVYTPHFVSKDGNIRSYRLDLSGSQELRLGTAYNPLTPHSFAPSIAEWRNYPIETPKNTIVGPKRWYTLNVDYGYWIKRWLYVGGAATWTGGFSRVSSVIDHSLVGYFNYTALSLMPTVRFSWLNRGVVQLYSSVGLGATVAIYEPEFNAPNRAMATIAYDVTLFGISVGRKWLGYLEIGAGMRGTICAGFGYRFNGKKS